METFSELNGSYYRAVETLLREASARPLQSREMRELLTRCAFAEGAFHMMPKLESGDWALLEGHEGKYTARCAPPERMPLTLLQRGWLRALLGDARVRLFFDDAEIDALDVALGDVAPLFEPRDIRVVDGACDGDPYADAGYRARFRRILRAMEARMSITIDYPNREGGKIIAHTVAPLKLQYSAKDDKFRLLCVHARRDRAPREYAPHDRATGERAPREHVMDDYATGEYVPHDHATGEYAPHDSVTGEYVPRDHATGNYATGDHAPHDHATGNCATGDHAPRDRVPHDSVTGEYATGNYTTGDHAPHDSVTGEYVPRDSAMGEYATGDHAPHDHATGNCATGDHAPHDHAPRGHITREQATYSTFNLARIVDVRAPARPMNAEWAYGARVEAPRQMRVMTLEISRERNALERCMLHFAHLEKRTEYDERRGLYLCQIRYDAQDESELLIRALSFGPTIRVLGNEALVKALRERVQRQARRLREGGKIGDR